MAMSRIKFRIKKDLLHFAGMLGIILAASYLVINMMTMDLDIPAFLPFLLLLIPIFAIVSWITDRYLIEDGVLYYYRWPGLKQRLCKVIQIDTVSKNQRKYGRYGYAFNRLALKIKDGSKLRGRIGVSPLDEDLFISILQKGNKKIIIEE